MEVANKIKTLLPEDHIVDMAKQSLQRQKILVIGVMLICSIRGDGQVLTITEIAIYLIMLTIRLFIEILYPITFTILNQKG